MRERAPCRHHAGVAAGRLQLRGHLRLGELDLLADERAGLARQLGEELPERPVVDPLSHQYAPGAV
jgi:hypothetical protein